MRIGKKLPRAAARILGILFCLFTTIGHAAGIKLLQILADASGPAIKGMVWTPCAEPAEEIPFGPFTLQGRRDCPTVGDKLPLVVISHGHTGSYIGHHDLAEVLANAGFVVAAINHPGDSFSDSSREGDMSVFVERPNDIKRWIDYMLGTAPDSARIDPQRIGFFGFSRGGYTGLVLAGGNPDFVHANAPCPTPRPPVCDQIERGEFPTTPLTHDARIKAFVIADPFDVFPSAADLENVNAPIQLWASEFGGEGVLPHTSPALAKALPRMPDYHLVRNAAHFAFLAPCSARMKKDVPEICVDPNGFDRGAFHKQFDASILAFFQANLH